MNAPKKDTILASDSKIDMHGIFEFFRKHYPKNHVVRMIEARDGWQYDRVNLHKGDTAEVVLSLHYSHKNLRVIVAPKTDYQKGVSSDGGHIWFSVVTRVTYCKRVDNVKERYYIILKGKSGVFMRIYATHFDISVIA